MNCKLARLFPRIAGTNFSVVGSGWSPARRDKVEESMGPIDYFTAVFVGMCIGLAGAAFVYG